MLLPLNRHAKTSTQPQRAYGPPYVVARPAHSGRYSRAATQGRPYERNDAESPSQPVRIFLNICSPQRRGVRREVCFLACFSCGLCVSAVRLLRSPRLEIGLEKYKHRRNPQARAKCESRGYGRMERKNRPISSTFSQSVWSRPQANTMTPLAGGRVPWSSTCRTWEIG